MDNLFQVLHDQDADLVGAADLSVIPGEKRQDLPYGLSIGIALDPQVLKLIPERATMEYYNLYMGSTARLDALAGMAAEYLRERGHRAVALTRDYVQEQRLAVQTQEDPGRAPLAHKTVAALAGLGWIAKNSLLITPQ